jgi:uncharacterized surface protein with fasciclin (FAS1) repeats
MTPHGGPPPGGVNNTPNAPFDNPEGNDIMRTPSTRLVAVGAVAGLLALSACGSDANDEADAPATTEAADAAEPGTIVEVAVGAGSFSTLVAAVEAAGLVDTLSGEGPFTVFAPTDDAFAALPEGVLDALLLPENQETLAAILTYHVVSGEVLSTDLTAGDVATVEGQSVTIGLDDGVTVNDANVVTADVQASNGVIHVIDSVLLPPDVDPAALLESDMSDDMTDEEAATEDDMAADEMADGNTIVDVAVEAGTFETLVAAVDAAGLVETLSGEGPFTVFAPTDDAFAALPEGLVDALLLPENEETLVAILTYHVVPGTVLSTDLAEGDVETVEGQTVAVSLEDGVFVNDSEVVAADIEASNGVIHVIDSVLLPPDVDPAALLG